MKRPDISVTIKPDAADVRYILQNLRDQDRYEFACVGLDPGGDSETLVALASSEHAMLFKLGNEPVFVWGIQRHGHIGILWGYGTAKTRRIIPAATRFGKRWWLPRAFDKEGIKRIEVRVPLKSQHSISWLRSLGMTVECWDIRNHSIDGSTMVQLAYTTREYIKDYVHVQSSNSGDADSNASATENVG